MRLWLILAALSFAWAQHDVTQAQQDVTHFSQVMGAERVYRVYLPATYAASKTRYPVVYWMHGFEESSVRDEQAKAFEAFAAAHDAIVVDFGPVETTGESPLYFAELVERVDQTLHTIPDRAHRGVAGYSTAGYLAQWTGAKFADLVASASSIAAPRESVIGPKGFEVECNLADLDYAGVRRAQPATAAEALAFHWTAFAKPEPAPTPFAHTDPYPNFSAWGWEAASNRRQPGLTELSQVSNRGFHSVVREWLPAGAPLAEVKLSLETPPRMFAPGSAHSVTYIRLPDGKTRRAVQKADAQGRLSFDLDGAEYEVGIADDAAIAVSGAEVSDAAWATAGQPVKLRVKFWNVGASRSATLPIEWESPASGGTDSGVKFDNASARLFGLGPGESAALPVTFTADGAEPMVRIVAVVHMVAGAVRMPVDIPVFPPAKPSQSFLIADGKPLAAFQPGSPKGGVMLGEGNGDGHASPGESFAVLLPDGDTYRLAELFTNDACVDNTVRIDSSAGRYSAPRILPECEPGHRIEMLARIETAEHAVRYSAIEIPVWFRN